MNGLQADLSELRAMAAGMGGTRAEIVVCPPATLVAAFAAEAGPHIAIGGQDCHAKPSGAHTGDVSAAMLRDAGCRYVIVGHSERRTDHGETDADVRAKAVAARSAGLSVIVCIGETEAEREAGRTLDVLGRQLAGSMPDGRPDGLVVAYEPIWAIGTGKTASLDDIAAAHAFIRRTLAGRYGPSGAALRVLYGGSVKPGNAKEILALTDVDGALVGGASLKATDFLAIIRAL